MPSKITLLGSIEMLKADITRWLSCVAVELPATRSPRESLGMVWMPTTNDWGVEDESL